MGVQVQDTGSTTQNISDIIDALNELTNSDSITNALSISAYGQIEVDVPFAPGETTTNSFSHGLTYPPMFIIKIVDAVGTDFDIPLIFDYYFYNSGLQDQGGYPYCYINAYADDQNINVAFSNIDNPSEFFVGGTFFFTYYIFSRPINATS